MAWITLVTGHHVSEFPRRSCFSSVFLLAFLILNSKNEEFKMKRNQFHFRNFEVRPVLLLALTPTADNDTNTRVLFGIYFLVDV